MGALRRYWEWETRLFRKAGYRRPGERLGAALGLAVVLVGVAIGAVAATIR